MYCYKCKKNTKENSNDTNDFCKVCLKNYDCPLDCDFVGGSCKTIHHYYINARERSPTKYKDELLEAEEKFSARIHKEAFALPRDHNASRNEFCVECGQKCHITFCTDTVISKWKCDECDTWNVLDEVMNKYTKVTSGRKGKPLISERTVPFRRPIVPKEPRKPIFLTDERKAVVKEKVSKLWFKKKRHVNSYSKSDDREFPMTVYIMTILSMVALSLATVFGGFPVNVLQILFSIGLTLVLITACDTFMQNGLKYVVRDISDISKFTLYYGFFASIIGGIGFGIYKLIGVII